MKLNLKIREFRDGGFVLSSGDMDFDLVFANGAMEKADPLYDKQQEYLQYIVDCVHNLQDLDDERAFG